MFDLKSYLTAKRVIIDNALNRILPVESTRISDAMRYSLMAGGKRLRPVLCIAAAEAVGGKSSDVLEVACAIEMIHTYSLIHDDLPAMDDDALRRGKPTCHAAFDESTAILAGDALLTLGFETLADVKCDNEKCASALLGVINRIAQAAGYKGMIEGQMRDIGSEGSILEPDELERMHALKTGAMIEVSTYAGAALGGGTPEQIERLETYARHIGLAFQVADDILNVEGDPAILGKAVGSDNSRNKNTYPSILGLEKSRLLARKMIGGALDALDSFDEKSEPLRVIAKYIIERNR